MNYEFHINMLTFLLGQEYNWNEIAVGNRDLHNLFAVYPTLQVWCVFLATP
jgi:hypothetical protein